MFCPCRRHACLHQFQIVNKNCSLALGVQSSCHQIVSLPLNYHLCTVCSLKMETSILLTPLNNNQKWLPGLPRAQYCSYCPKGAVMRDIKHSKGWQIFWVACLECKWKVSIAYPKLRWSSTPPPPLSWHLFWNFNGEKDAPCNDHLTI